MFARERRIVDFDPTVSFVTGSSNLCRLTLAPDLAKTLVPNFYKSNCAMKDFMERSDLAFTPAISIYSGNSGTTLRAFYEITKRIWGV
jgi:hypothetical protein